MMDIGGIQGWIKLRDDFSTTLDRVKNAMGDVSARATQFGKSLQSSVGGAATKTADKMKELNVNAAQVAETFNSAAMHTGVATVVALGAAAIGTALALRQAVDTSKDFEKSMDTVGAVAGATGVQFEMLTNAARELGAGGMFSANEIAKGMETMARAGYSATQIIDIMPAAMDLAVASATELNASATILARALAAFSIPAVDAAVASDALTTAANSTNTSISNLAVGLRYAGPIAHQLGISINDTAAAMGILADAGMDGSMAGTGLRRAFSEIVAPTKLARKAIAEMGLEMEQLDPQTNGLIGALDNFRLGLSALDSDTERTSKAMIIFGDRGAPAVLALTQNMDRLREVTDRVRNSAGSTATVAERMFENLAGAGTKLGTAFNEVLLSMGEGLLKPLTDTTNAIRELISQMSPFAEQIGKTAGTLIGTFGKAIKFVADNATLFKMALGAIIAVQIAPWLLTVGTGLLFVIKNLGIATMALMNLELGAGSLKGALTALSLSNPFTAAIAGALALGALFDTLINRSRAASAEMINSMTRTADEGAKLAALQAKPPEAVTEKDVKDAEQAAKDILAVYTDMTNKIGKLRPGSKEAQWAVDNLKHTQMQYKKAQKTVENVSAAWRLYGKAIEDKKLAEINAKKAAAENAAALEDMRKELDKALGTLDAVYPVQKQYEENVKALTKAYELGAIGVVEYEAGLVGLAQKFNEAKAAALGFKIEAQEIKKLDVKWSIETDFATGPVLDDPKFYIPFEKMSRAQQIAATAAHEHNKAIAEAAAKQEAFNILVASGAMTMETAAAAVGITIHNTDMAAVEAKELAKEWENFQKQVEENFIRGVQNALSDFFLAVFEGGEDAMKNFANALKDLLFKTLAEYLAQWIILQAKMFMVEAARIIKTKALQKAAGVGGTGPVADGAQYADMLKNANGSQYMSMLKAAWPALVGIAAVAAVAAIAKYQKDQHEKQRYATDVTAGMYGGDFYSQWRGKLTETGKKAAAALKELIVGIQAAAGVFIEGMKEISIRIRNDKKSFMLLIGGELIGYFGSLKQAIQRAVEETFKQSGTWDQLPQAVRDAVQNFQGDDVSELVENVKKIQDLINEIEGLTQVEIDLRSLSARADELSASLRGMGVSIAETSRLVNEWRVGQLQSLRDQITGHQQTEAEARAQFERQRALFNAQLALYRAEIAAEIRRLEMRAKGVELTERLNGIDGDLQLQRLNGLGEVIAAEAELYNQEIAIRSAYLANSAAIVNTEAELLRAQIENLKVILANLPKEIGPGEFKWSGGGNGAGGGVSSGPSREERRTTAQQQLDDLANQLLPDLVQRSLALTLQFATLREEMQALGMATAQLDALEAAHRARLQQEAMAEVAQYTQNPYQLALAEILAWGVEMTAVYEELGLSLEEVQEAEEQRIADLIAQAEAIVGIPQVDQQWKDMADALEFLKSQLDAGAISAEDYARAVESAGNMATMALVDSLMAFVDDEETKLALEQMRWAAELANIMLQFEYLKSINALTEEQIALVQGLIDKAKEGGPPKGEDTGGGGGFSGAAEGGPRDVGGGEDLAEAIKDLVKALRDWLDSVRQDTSVSPLTLAQRFALAQQEYQQTLAAAQGNPLLESTQDAIAALPDAAQAYLELAAQMFGTSSMSYQTLFENVLTAVEGLADILDAATEWDRFFWYAERWDDYLEDIRDSLSEGWGDDPSDPTSRMAGTSTTGTRALANEALERAVREAGEMIADEVCRTGDANNDELRAIRRTLERAAVRPSAADRRLAAGAPAVTLRRRIA